MSNFNKVGPDLNEKGDIFIGQKDSIRQTVPEEIGKT